MFSLCRKNKTFFFHFDTLTFVLDRHIGNHLEFGTLISAASTALKLVEAKTQIMQTLGN